MFFNYACFRIFNFFDLALQYMASSSAPSSGPSTHCTNTSSTRFTPVLWRTLASLCNLACGKEASTIHKKEFTGDVHTQALPHVNFAFTLGFFFFILSL